MTTTSGDISVTAYDQTQLIELAGRRCGKLAGSMSAEEILYSQLELSMVLNQMVNEGVPLFTVNKQIYGLNINQYLLQLSPDTVDLQNVLYRYNTLPSGGTPSASTGNAANAFDQNLSTACIQSVPNGYIEYNFGTPVVIVTVGLLPNATGTLNPTYQYSVDGINWITSVAAASVSSTYTAGQWYWLDVVSPQTAQYYRILETSGGTLNVTELVFGTQCNEIIISPLNKDDYQNLPFKNAVGQPLQYWFDRQIIPQMWLWRASQFSFNTLVIWSRRIIQNVGALTDSLEFPNRFLDYIIATLAIRMAMIIPGIDLPTRMPILEQQFAMAKELAWREERASGPLYFGVNLSGYTGYASGNGY
jgi:hypothetical protein